MEGAMKALCVGGSNKGKSAVHVRKPSARTVEKDDVEGVEHMKAKDVLAASKVVRNKSNLEDLIAILRAKISSAMESYREVKQRREILELEAQNRANSEGFIANLKKTAQEVQEAIKGVEKDL